MKSSFNIKSEDVLIHYGSQNDGSDTNTFHVQVYTESGTHQEARELEKYILDVSKTWEILKYRGETKIAEDYVRLIERLKDAIATRSKVIAEMPEKRTGQQEETLRTYTHEVALIQMILAECDLI